MRRAARLLSFVLISALLAGCEGNLTLPGGSRASWRYVEKGWGGLASGAPSFHAGFAILPLRLGVHPAERADSGICLAKVSAKVRGTWIVVRLHRAICGPGSITTLGAAIARPPAGRYRVVYDDFLAGYPKIGEARIP